MAIKKRKTEPWCDHYKSQVLKIKLEGEIHVFQVRNLDPKQQSSSESLPFKKEQMKYLYKMFQSQILGSSNTSCSLAPVM